MRPKYPERKQVVLSEKQMEFLALFKKPTRAIRMCIDFTMAAIEAGVISKTELELKYHKHLYTKRKQKSKEIQSRIQEIERMLKERD